jgi:hypothetical protein
MPDVNAIIQNSFLFIFLMIGMSFCGTFVIVALVIWLIRRAINPNARLLTAGEPATATILTYWDTGTTVNDNPLVGFTQSVQRAGGQPPYQVQTQGIESRLSIAKLQQGAVVSVRIDPSAPEKVVIVGF